MERLARLAAPAAASVRATNPESLKMEKEPMKMSSRNALAPLARLTLARKALLLLPLLFAFAPVRGAQADLAKFTAVSINNLDDSNGDGFAETAQLNWSSDMISGAQASVYVSIYYRTSGGSWQYYGRSGSEWIYGNETGDDRSTIISMGASATYDFRIELFRDGASTADDYKTLYGYAMGGGASANDRATLANAWWTKEVDADLDGYKETARLNWDPNVAVGSAPLKVFEKLYLKRRGATSPDWLYFYTTPVHTITGTSTADAQFIDLTAQDRNICDFKIEVYREGQTDFDYERNNTNDADLSGYKLSPLLSSLNRVTIAEAWWDGAVDSDGNGFMESATLYWNPNVAVGPTSQSVHEKVYYRYADGPTWTELASIPSHTISGISTADIQHINVALDIDTVALDFKIEIYRDGQLSPDEVRSNDNDSDLAEYKMGIQHGVNGDTVAVSDAWWTNEVDQNGNGYKSAARLNWNPDIYSGPDQQTIYEKVYSKLSGSAGGWTLVASTTPHVVEGLNVTDLQYVDVTGGPQDLYDWKIEIWHTDRANPDSVPDSPPDPDLAQYKMEPAIWDDPAQALPTPFFNPAPAPGRTHPLAVEILCEVPMTEIRYTSSTSGTPPPDPTLKSALLPSGQTLTMGYGTTTVKARAYKTGKGPSAVATATYQINTPVHTVTRILPSGYTPGAAVPVQISVKPDAGTLSWTLEETPPAGWTISNIQPDGGVWNAATKTIQWAPFTGANPVTLFYYATPPQTETGTKSFSGSATLDGLAVPVGGATSLVRTPDRTAPQALSIARLDAAATSASTVSFEVTFSEPVNGVDPADFTPAADGSLGGLQVAGLSGGPIVYTVAVYTGATGEGRLKLNLNGASGIVDWSGNAIASGFSGGQSYFIDHAAPVFDVQEATPALARLGASVQLQVTASEPLQSSPTLTVNTHPAVIMAHSGPNYTFQYTVQASDPDGPAAVAVAGKDLVSNAGGFISAALLTVDKVPPPPPTALSLDPADDSGALSNDGVTNHNTGLTVRGVAEAGSIVLLRNGATTLGSLTAADFAAAGKDIILPEGMHYITAVATDAAGNVSPIGAALALRVDLTAPTPGAASAPAYAKASPIPVTCGGAADAGGLSWVRLWFKPASGAWQDSGQQVTGGAGTFSFTPSGEGAYAFALVAEDLAGNRSAQPAGAGDAQTTYDLTAPRALSISLLDPPLTNAAAVRFMVTFSEPVSGVATNAFALAAGGSLTGSQISGVAGGPTVYTVTASSGSGAGSLRLDLNGSGVQDLAGNALAAPFSGGPAYQVDRQAPAFSGLSASPTLARLGTVVSLSFVVSEALSTSPTLTVNGMAATIQSHAGLSYTCRYTVQDGDPDGAATVSISGADSVGNPCGVNFTNVLTIDKTAPDAPSDLELDAADDSGASSADLLTNQASALTVRGAAEDGSTVQLWEGSTMLASGSAADFAGPGLDVSLAEGSHPITARATDPAGNVSPLSLALTLRVDKTAPSFSGLTATPASARLGTSVAIGFKASEELAASPAITINGHAATITGQTGQAYTAEYIVSAADGDGPLTAAITGTDQAGNPGTTSTPGALQVDNHAPGSSMLATSALTSTDTLTLRWAASDPATGGYASGVKSVDVYWRYRGGKPQKLGTFTPDVTSLKFDLKQHGSYGSTFAFHTVATDVNGNVEPTPASPDWSYRWSPPRSAAGPAWTRYE